MQPHHKESWVRASFEMMSVLYQPRALTTRLTQNFRDAEDFEPGAHKLVLTTYGTLSQEVDGKSAGAKSKKRKKHASACTGLMDTCWTRVVLDEAHTIRNNKTKTYSAALALKTSYR
jgi:SNF2 family DNA or RNA helicase